MIRASSASRRRGVSKITLRRTIYIFGRIYTAAIVYSLERIVSRPAKRKPAYRPQATFASSN